MLEKKHAAVISLGLGPSSKFGTKEGLAGKFTESWVNEGIEPYLVPLHWGDKDHTDEQKRQLLIQKITELRCSQLYKSVSILGISAGAGPAFSVWWEMNDVLSQFVSFGGAIIPGKDHNLRHVKRVSKKFPHLQPAVQHAQERAQLMTPELGERVHIFHGLLDELIHPEMSQIPHANRIEMKKLAGHWLLTNFGFIFYRHDLIQALTNPARMN